MSDQLAKAIGLEEVSLRQTEESARDCGDAAQAAVAAMASGVSAQLECDDGDLAADLPHRSEVHAACADGVIVG
jgi:hypothetical protein